MLEVDKIMQQVLFDHKLQLFMDIIQNNYKIPKDHYLKLYNSIVDVWEGRSNTNAIVIPTPKNRKSFMEFSAVIIKVPKIQFEFTINA